MLAAVLSPLTPARSADEPSAPLAELERHQRTVGRFVQRRYIPSLEDPVESRGRFFYDAGRGAIWRVEEPVESELVIVDDAVYQDGEAVEAAPVLDVVEALLRALFAGERAPIERRFHVERGDSASGWRVELSPRDDITAGAIEAITLTGQKVARSVTIRVRDDSRTELVFTELRHPGDTPERVRRTFERTP